MIPTRKKNNKPEAYTLPPFEDFRLHNILNNFEDSKQVKRQLIESVTLIKKSYTKDLDNQIEYLIDVENDSILKHMNSIEDNYLKIGKRAKEELNNRKLEISKINKNLVSINDQLAVSRDKVDRLISKLKKVEKKMTLKDQLFNLKTPHESHYQELFNYGMKEEIKNKNRKKKSLTPPSRRKVFNDHTPVEIPKPIIVTHNKMTDESSSPSPQKLKQYLSLESEIDELRKQRTQSISKFTNPVKLISPDSPTCKISGEIVTRTSYGTTISTTPVNASSVNISKVKSDESENETVNLLTDLKKLNTKSPK